MNLFIDTNILLSFYHLTSDDLEELRKLAVLLKQKSVSFLLTDQVVDEFNRNREAKISDAIKRLKDQRLNLQFPQMCKDYPEYSELRDLQKQYDDKHSSLLKKLQADISSKKLKADETIEALFSVATKLTSDEGVISRARLRVDVGNPPGKGGSLGDAINWELLLSKVPIDEDIFFVTEDRDYFSSLDEDLFKEFLLTEWQTKKRSQLHSYKRLSSFFNDQFPDIKLAAELEKDLLIKQFIGSRNFTNTHAIVAKLSEHTDFSINQASEILSAALSNSQILWILTDEDVKTFIASILEIHAKNIDPKIVESLVAHLNPKPPEKLVALDDDDVPF